MDEQDYAEMESACRAMWLAVIEQALRDMHSPSRELRQSARLWLTGKSIGLRIVCDLAGINVDALQRGLRQHGRSRMPSARMGCVRREMSELVARAARQKEDEMKKKYLFLAAVARQLNISRTRLYHLLRAGRVQGAVLQDGRWEVPLPPVILPPRPKGRPRKSRQNQNPA